MSNMSDMSFGETALLQNELVNDYSYRVDGVPGMGMMDNSQYDFNHVQNQPPPSSYMQRAGGQGGGGGRMTGAPASRGAFGRGPQAETARPMTSNRAAGYT